MSAPTILDGLACGSPGCECAASVRRGRGKTHCPAHTDPTPSFNVELGEGDRVLFHCHGGCTQAAAVEALEERGLWGVKGDASIASGTGAAMSQVRAVAEYVYTDAGGAPLFHVERYEPKDFRQRKADGTRSGIAELWTLYNLPAVLRAVAEREPTRPIYVVEGEKDADALTTIEVIATTSPGGAGKWQDRYGDHLIGADVVIIADKDEPGRAHARDVAQKLSIVARSIKVIEVPDGKDVSDWLATDPPFPADQLKDLAGRVPEWNDGEPRVIYTGRDMARTYRDIIERRQSQDPEVIGWPTGFPVLDHEMAYRAGDLWLVAAATGVGKTTFLQTMQSRIKVASAFFSVEQPLEQLLDRVMANATHIDSWRIAHHVLRSQEHAQVMAEIERLEQREDVVMVDAPGLTTGALERLLRVMRVRFGTRIAYVDYVQQLADREGGEGEYARVTRISKNLARIARETGTCIVAAAQVARRGDRADGAPPQKSDLRDSGYLESDAAVVLAIGRVEGAKEASLAVRKNRHGNLAGRIDMIFEGSLGRFRMPMEIV